MDEAGAELHLNDSVSLRVRRVISDVPDVHLLRLLCVRVVVHARRLLVAERWGKMRPHLNITA